ISHSVVAPTQAPDPAPAVEDAEKPIVPVEDEEKETIHVTDTADLKDAMSAAIKRHTEVIEKDKTFVDEYYSFAGRSTAQIMRDALAVEHGKQEFSDAELTVAFKLLKKSGSDLRTFGDASPSAGKFASIADKEI